MFVSLGSAASSRARATEEGAASSSNEGAESRGKLAVFPAARSAEADSVERMPGAGLPHLGQVRSWEDRRAPQPSQNTNSLYEESPTNA